MNTRKSPEKDGTYPPAPSVRDDASAALREQDSDDSCHEFDEAYMQAYVSYKRLQEELGQEEVEEGEEGLRRRVWTSLHASRELCGGRCRVAEPGPTARALVGSPNGTN